jgi:hypothetical protein
LLVLFGAVVFFFLFLSFVFVEVVVALVGFREAHDGLRRFFP